MGYMRERILVFFILLLIVLSSYCGCYIVDYHRIWVYRQVEGSYFQFYDDPHDGRVEYTVDIYVGGEKYSHYVDGVMWRGNTGKPQDAGWVWYPVTTEPLKIVFKWKNNTIIIDCDRGTRLLGAVTSINCYKDGHVYLRIRLRNDTVIKREGRGNITVALRGRARKHVEKSAIATTTTSIVGEEWRGKALILALSSIIIIVLAVIVLFERKIIIVLK